MKELWQKFLISQPASIVISIIKDNSTFKNDTKDVLIFVPYVLQIINIIK